MKKIRKLMALFLALLVGGMFISAAGAQDVSIIPSSWQHSMEPNVTEEDSVRVVLPPVPPAGDVAFVFDSTGSMSGCINDMMNHSVEIMQGVRAEIADTNFGVASFMDYTGSYYTPGDGYEATYGYASSGDYPWKMDLDLTSNIVDVENSINALTIGSGGDYPQDYSRAVYELQTFSWRTDAKKIAVLFGDNQPHSYPSGEAIFGVGQTKGADPGRDGIIGTADDLDYVPVIEDIASQNIAVITVHCSDLAAAETNFRYIAEQTGGDYYHYTEGISDIVDGIVDEILLVSEEPIAELTLEVVEPQYASWVVWNPDAHYNVPWGEERTFDIEITSPEGTCGVHVIHINVVGDGVVLGTITVTKNYICETPEFPTFAVSAAMIFGMVMIMGVLKRRDE